MGEGTNSAGGYLLAPEWNAALIRQVKEYSGLMNDMEQWDSPHGSAAKRPVVLVQNAAATDSENGAFTEGPDFVASIQSWSLCPTYAASTRVSFQLVQDADSQPPLDVLVRSLLSESLGRAVAPVATTAAYAAINTQGSWSAGDSGGYLQLGTATAISLTSGASTELSSKTVALDTAAQMVAAIDTSYLDGAKFYLTQTAWMGLARQVDSQKRYQLDPSANSRSLLGFPVVLTSGATDAAASTVCGPVFGNLQAGMTLRVANGGTVLLRSSERYGDFAQMYYRAAVRMDIGARDSRAVVGVKYSTS